MKECKQNHCVFVCLFFLGLLLTVPTNASASLNDMTWMDEFESQILEYPSVVAARERVFSAELVVEGAASPLYNPEISTSYEREGESNNYRVGVEQSLDWHDNVAANIDKAKLVLAEARASYELAVMDQATESYIALVRWQAAYEKAELARKRKRHFDNMRGLLEKRKESGDLGQLDTELAILGMSRQLTQTARAKATLKRMNAKVMDLLPKFTNQKKAISDKLFSRLEQFSELGRSDSAEQWLTSHPIILKTKTDWQSSQITVEQIRKSTKATPKIGISAGKAGDDTVMGVSVALPLNIRNDYSASVKSASKEALAKEAVFYSVWRQQKVKINSSIAALNAYETSMLEWRTLMQDRGSRGEELITRQWDSGDLSTSEYLLALQQLSDGLSAGIELEEQYRLALVNWLAETGQMTTVLTQRIVGR